MQSKWMNKDSSAENLTIMNYTITQITYLYTEDCYTHDPSFL